MDTRRVRLTNRCFLCFRSSPDRVKDRARVYIVNTGNGSDENEEEDNSSLVDDILKFSEKHEFEVTTFVSYGEFGDIYECRNKS